MNRYLIILLLASTLPGQAQNNIDDVLKSIEANNKELLANKQLTRSKTLEAGIGNTLPDPTVTYEYMYGSPEQLGKTGELTIAQSFDFPTVYTNKSKIAHKRSSLYGFQEAAMRQSLLLRAKELCIDIILLNQQNELLHTRLTNTEKLASLYDRRLQNGDANILEKNKIDLELLNVKTEVRLNESNRSAKMQELQLLNGNTPIPFTDTAYQPAEAPESFESVEQSALAADPFLQSFNTEQEIARRQINLSRAEWFPKFELGYRRNTGLGEQFNGFLVGVSIPLYENRNKIRQAKAQTSYTSLVVENASLQSSSELRRLYDQSLSLKVAIDDYTKVLDSQNNIELLIKALENGQISMIEYFIEATTFYQSLQNYYDLQNQYQKTIAQLYKYQL